jgi:hypothetical protein
VFRSNDRVEDDRLAALVAKAETVPTALGVPLFDQAVDPVGDALGTSVRCFSISCPLQNYAPLRVH